jgi:cytoskeletal protein CcmA (bactofilin family)
MESPMAEVRIKDIDEQEIDTILAEDIDFEGHLTFKKPLMIKGKFKGEIKSTSSLYIGEKALVEATTEAAVVSSKGSHRGDIVGHTRVELFSTAQVEGDISTPDFVVESGCKFNGYCNMGGGLPQRDGARHAHPAQGSSPQPTLGLAPAGQQPAQPQPGPHGGQQPAGQQRQQGQQGPPQQPNHHLGQAQNPQANQQQGPQQNPQQKPPGQSQGSGGQQR